MGYMSFFSLGVRGFWREKASLIASLRGRPLAQQQIQIVLNHINKRVPVIGVGGIDTAEKAQTLLDMGCAAVQLYSALIFHGPKLIQTINSQLIKNRNSEKQT